MGRDAMPWGSPKNSSAGGSSRLAMSSSTAPVGDGAMLAPGKIISNRYELSRLLGQGGMGQVWLVRDHKIKALRAMKLIVAGIVHDRRARSRFKREPMVMAEITHPNAVSIHDAELAEEDLAYIVMEYVQGQSIDKLFRQGMPMPLDWTARILDQLCDVLETVHGHNPQIIHRDLKPSNLMLLEGRPPG